MSTVESCRWCGSKLNTGFNLCTICNKNQNRFHNLFGEGSNLIGLLAALLTFAQLMVAIEQNNKAVDAAEISEKAKINTEKAVAKFEKLESRFKQIEIDTRQAASEIKQTSLKIQAIESKENKQTIIVAQNELALVRESYDNLKLKLDNTSSTIRIPKQITTTKKQCTDLGFTKLCKNVPVIKTINQNVANPEYKALQLRLESKQAEVNAKELALSSVLGN